MIWVKENRAIRTWFCPFCILSGYFGFLGKGFIYLANHQMIAFYFFFLGLFKIFLRCARELSLVVASEGYPLLPCPSFSLRLLLVVEQGL